ncbi:MAG: ABC transporter permease, partial [Planctomycetota bacterium]
DNDEDYWDTHRGTPKAFVTLAAGQAMWSSRYGDLTAIRLANSSAEKAAKQLEQRIDPASLGLFFVDIRGPALRATQATTDFGQLFLALSFVLMGSALLLTAMLFAFNIELRSAEIGAQLAVGLPPRTVQGLLLAEGAVIASLGALLGAPFGVLFSAGILALLRSVWADAIASASVSLHIAPATIAIGVTSAVIAAGLAMLVSMRGLLRRGPVALLTGDRPQPRTSSAASGIVLAIGMVFLGGAAAAAFLIDPAGPAAAGAFLGIGSALLIGGLAVAAHAIARLGSPAGSAGLPSIRSLGLRGTARRAARSIATVALVAIGVFLVVAVSVNRIDPLKNADLRASGTGGFALIAESTIPLPVSLDQQRGRDLLGLDEDDTAGASFVHLRVRDGDDASCLNLNLAQNPRLLGVDPESLAGRGAFTFKRFTDETEPSWHALSARAGPVPAIVDDASAQWAMHKGIGDTITYVDGAGEPFEVVIVGTVATSILQGSVIIDAATFRERFPRVQGFAMTLIDAPSDRASDIAATLTRAGSDLGMELTPAARRLGEFSAVQNTYLAIFQVLGGLGLLLGTLGLAAVVLRNVFERRKEFAVLRAVGLSPALVRGLVVIEHVFLLGLGLALGVSVAAVAVVPTLLSATDSPPVALTTALVLGMTLFGWAAVSFAARRATAADVAGTLAREG